MAMDEFSKIKTATKRQTFVREQIHIVYLGLGLEEAYHPWSYDGNEYTSVELLEHFVKVCLPLTKSRKLPDKPPLEYPALPEFPVLGTLSKDIEEYYTEQTKNENELRLKALQEREKEELMGIWDGAEYINAVNWPTETLTAGYKIEMVFSYPGENEDNRLMWCCGEVTRVKKRNDTEMVVDIKWGKDFVAEGENEKGEEILKKGLWNPEKPRKGAWRKDMQEFLNKNKVG